MWFDITCACPHSLKLIYQYTMEPDHSQIKQNLRRAKRNSILNSSPSSQLHQARGPSAYQSLTPTNDATRNEQASESTQRFHQTMIGAREIKNYSANTFSPNHSNQRFYTTNQGSSNSFKIQTNSTNPQPATRLDIQIQDQSRPHNVKDHKKQCVSKASQIKLRPSLRNQRQDFTTDDSQQMTDKKQPDQNVFRQKQEASNMQAPLQLSKNDQEGPLLSRQSIQQKFQRCVWEALDQKKADNQQNNDLQHQGLDTQSEFDTQQLASQRLARSMQNHNQQRRNQINKPRPSIIDVVRKLNPFFKREGKIQPVDDQASQSQSNFTSRHLLDNADDELEMKRLEEQKRVRAQQLWKKAKRVLQAIMTWKAIQSEIQLYGTHNYQFRKNFKIRPQDGQQLIRSGLPTQGYHTLKTTDKLLHSGLSNLEIKQVIDQIGGGIPVQDEQGNILSGDLLRIEQCNNDKEADFCKNALASRPQEKSNDNAIAKNKAQEAQRKRQSHVYIHPDSTFRNTWSFFLLLMLFYVATVMPYTISFIDYGRFSVWYYIDIVVDVFFILDLFINFFYAYYDNDKKLVTNNKTLAKNYLKSWFIVDLVASFPLSLVLIEMESEKQLAHSYNRLFKLLRLPRLYRIIKLGKLTKLLSFLKKSPFILRLQDFFQINSGALRMLKFIFTALICLHIVASLWFLSAKLNDFGPDTWVARFGIKDASNGRQYLSAIYWSTATVLTVGYGDISATTNSERIISILWMMIGVGFYSFTIGTLTSVLSKIDTRQSQLRAKTQVIEVFCKEAKINIELKKRIKEALEYNSQKNAFSWIEKYSIFNELPPNLKCEIAMQIHEGAIGKLPFFQNKDSAFIGNIVPLLQPLRVVEQDYIFMEGEHPYDIYFIVKGRVNFVMDTAECVFKTWPQGAYFGEIEVIFKKKRICTAKASIECDLFTLSKKFYNQIVATDYPTVDKQLRQVALEKENRIYQTIKKAQQVLDAIGTNDEDGSQMQVIQSSRRRSRASSVCNYSQKHYIKKISKAATQAKVAKSFERASKNSSYVNKTRSLREDESQQQSQSASQCPDSDSDSDSSSSNSSGVYNIWDDNKSVNESSQGGNDKTEQMPRDKIQDSFQTDRSLGEGRLKDGTSPRNNQNNSERLSSGGPSKRDKEEEKELRPSQDVYDFISKNKGTRATRRGVIRPPNSKKNQLHPIKNQGVPNGYLDLVKEEASIDVVSKETPNVRQEQEDSKDKEQVDDSVPRIKIMESQDDIDFTQKSNNHQLLASIKTSPITNTGLEQMPQTLRDSNYLSNSNDFSQLNLFQGKNQNQFSSMRGPPQPNLSYQVSPILPQTASSNIVPVIKINEIAQHQSSDEQQVKALNQSQYELSPQPVSLQAQARECEFQSKVCEMQILPKSNNTQNKSKRSSVDVSTLNNQVKSIQREIQNNQQHYQSLDSKVESITSSLDLISRAVRDIVMQQQRQQETNRDQEQRMRQEPMRRISQTRTNQMQQIPLLFRNNTGENQSPQQLYGQIQQLQARVPMRHETTDSQFGYVDDLQHLQLDHENTENASSSSIPKQ